MNNSRVNFTEIQTLTRSEYVSAKLIPSAAPLKKIEPEEQDGSTAIEPTPKIDSISTSKRYVRENEEHDLHLFEKPKRRAVNKSELYDSANDTHLSEQIRQYNRVIEAQVQEVEYFKDEIRRLQDEKMLNVQNYEQKLMNYRDQESIKYELERRVRFLESEKAALEDDLNRQKLRVSSLEFEIEQLRRQNMTQHDLHLKIEELNGEVRYHENQVKQARVIQISLEQELRQRADERALLISEYEIRIANLQNDLVLHKETRKLDDSDQNHVLSSLREENLNLSNDNKNLRNVTRDLQNQIDRIREEHFQTEMALKKRINEFETANSNSLLAAESYNVNKVLLMIEIDRLRDELNQQIASKNLSVVASPPRAFDEQSKRAAAIKTVNSPEMISKNQALEAKNQNLEQAVSQLENKTILFMIEIERLGIIVQELQNENTFLRQKSIELDQNYQKQIDDFQQQYEFVIRPQIEAELRNTTNSIEREKKTLELEIYDHKNEAVRLKNEIFMLQAENTKMKDRNRELTSKLEDTVGSYERFVQESNNMKRSLEEESRLKLVQQREGIDMILIQERQSHQKDIAVYKERILELENRITSLSLQINGLQRNLDDSDDQINILKNKLVEAENERIHQLEQLRGSLETNFRQTYQTGMELKIMQLEALQASLEEQLKKSKDEIAYLEEQNGILNRETEQLVIEISEKTTLIEQYHSQIILLKDQNQEIYALPQKQQEIQTQFVEEAKQRELSLEKDYQDRLEKDLKKAHDNFHNEKAAFETHQQQNQGALNDEISHLQAQMQKLHEENQEILGQKALFEAEIQKLEQEHQEALNNERVAFDAELQRLEREKAVLESQLQKLQQEHQQILDNERLGFEAHLQKLQQENQQIYDNERLAFEAQLERLKQENQGALSDELSQLQAQIEKLYQENQRILDNERTGFEAHIQQLEQDHQRILNNERAAFEAELQKLKQEKATLEAQLQKLGQDHQETLDNERLAFEAELQKLEQEKTVLETQLQTLEQDHQETLNNERLQFESHLQRVQIENQHLLDNERTDFEAQIEELRKQNQQILDNERLGFEAHLQKLQQDHQEITNNERAALEAQFQTLEQEKAILENQLQQSEQEHQQVLDTQRLGFEAHLQKVQQEHQEIMNNERAALEAQLQILEQEKAILENQLQQSEQEHQQVLDHQRLDFESHLQKVQVESQNLLDNERNSFEAQLQRLEQENGELHTRLLENISVIEQLQTAATQSGKENQTLISQRDNLLAEIEKLHVNFETQIRQNIEIEIENVSTKYNQEKREIQDSLFALQAQNQDLRVKAILYMAEIERLHTIIFEIEKEEDVWRERIIEMENQNALRLEEQKNEYEEILRDKLVTEIEKIQTRAQEEKRTSDNEVNLLQNRNKEIEEALVFTNQENSRLRSECLEKEDELQTLMIRINNLAHEQEEYVRGLKIGIQTQLRIDFENQIKDITGRFNNEKTAFEDQIRQLRNRVSEMELKLMTVQTQNDNLHRNLEDSYNQIDVLKNRCFELETEAVQAQKKLQESPKKASPQKEKENAMLRAQVQELEQKNQEYFRDLSLLSVEIERISKINFDLKSEAENLRIKAESLERRSQVEIDQTKIKLEIQFREERENMAKEINTRFLTEIKNYDAQVMDLRKKLIDYEGDMSLLTNEIQRLSALLSDKNEELDVWKGKVRSIEESKNQELQEIKQKRDFDQRIILEQELRNLLDHFSIEKAQYDFKIKDLQQKNADYENKIVAITAELDKFKSLYQEKLQHIENLKRQSPARSDYSTVMEYEEMRLHLESLKRNSLQISDYEVRFQAERTAYETQIMQYKHKIEELETIIVSITRESQRLSSHLHEKGIEVQNIRKQSGFIGMVDIEEHQKLQRENENLKKLLLENQEARVRFEVERSDYQSQVVQLKQIIEVNQLEMKKLYGLLESRKVENEALYNDLNKTREEMARNLREFKRIEAEYNMMHQKSTNVNKEIEDLQNARDMYRTQLEKNEIELTLKNKELLEKICQIDVLKAKYEEAIANVDPYTSTIITRISTTRQDLI